MKYLILIYHNAESREIWNGLSDEQRAAGLKVYGELNADLRKSGELIVTEALAEPAHARRVRVRDEKIMTTDGPFAEVKEFLAGFYLVECPTMDRAVEIAARIPEASFMHVEVLPSFTYPGMET
jgi:hypothetical protein